MKKLFLLLVAFFLVPALVLAAGEGTYGNETYGNYSYGVSSSASASFTNNSVSVPANTPTIINGTSTNAVLELNTNSNAAGAVTLVKYDSQPPSVSTNTFASPLNKYLDVVVDNSISSQLNYSIIKMYYTDAEVSAADLQESTMRLSKWNGSSWVEFDGAGIGGVDATNNYVWANTSSFSVWGLFGTTNPAPSPAPSGGGAATGGGGGGGGNWGWECSSWSECSPSGTQSRTCNLVPGGSLSSKPAETQACTYTAPASTVEEEPAPAVPITPIPATEATPPAPAVPTGAAVAPPTGLAKLTGAFISDLKKPGTWIGIVVAILVAAALYAGYYYLYRKKQ